MIRLLVDSAADIAFNNMENIAVVPLSVHINDQDYLAGLNLKNDDFYKMLEVAKEFPKTSQPSPQQFALEFEKAKKNGDELICILLSSGVSGTYQSACLAKDLVDYDKIHIIDSLTGSVGVKQLVDVALRRIAEGVSSQDIVSELLELRKRVRVFISVETLDYLYKGGRLDKKSTIIGNIAKVKPIIEVTRAGKIGVQGKTIGKVRAMNAMIDLMDKYGVDENYPVYSIYTLGDTNVSKLEKKIIDASYRFDERIQLGPVVGSHVGPETFGVIYMSKKED